MKISKYAIGGSLLVIITVTASIAASFAYAQGAQREAKTVLFFGDSITAGFGLDPDQAFPALIQTKVNQEGWNIHIINAGLSGETSAGGVRRIDWVLQRSIDVLVLELGGNDGLRGIDLTSTKQNLQDIMDRAREQYPDVNIILAGMQIPPNMGPEYIQAFRDIYPALADENDVTLLPFLLKDVGGIRELNQSDGIHPTPQGHAVVAETVWTTLRPVLQRIQQ
ncbi:MAG: arylesterase [Candidatus Latescibacteria bacterium]|nr:arylesterase [Candidatus Latescibacterota bacterium]